MGEIQCSASGKCAGTRSIPAADLLELPQAGLLRQAWLPGKTPKPAIQLHGGGASAKLALVATMVLHFLIQGRVQGVGFRWFVQREASELDLRGWVRNTEDGDVEVVASGDAEDLAELRASLRRGPRGSRVDRLIEHYLDDSEAEDLDAFRIEGAW